MSMRILMTLDAVGGVWRYAMDLGGALAAAGHEVVFAGFGPRPSEAQRAEAGAIGPMAWSAAPLDWMAEGPGALSGVPELLAQVAARHQVDLMHLNLPSQAAGLRSGPPRVVVTHSCLATWFRALEDRPVPDHLEWQARLTREGLHAADRAVAPSVYHARQTADVHGVPLIEAVPNASRSPLSDPSEGDGQVVAAARWWDKAKNGTTLDRATASAGAEVVMIGGCEGPDGQVFAPGHARATGPLPHDETIGRLAAASLFVSPSLYEPFGLATLEAARAARPLLLADIPVYRELWDGAAVFFDPRDPVALSGAMTALLSAPGERLALGAAARRRALRFTPDRQVATMTDLYTRIAAPSAESVTP